MAARKPASSAARILLEYARRNLDRRRNRDTLFYHGAALYRAGRYKEAERDLTVSAKAPDASVNTWAWLFQAMVARQLGKHDEASRLPSRFESWYGKQAFPTWQQRVSWEMVLREARTVVRGLLPMPRLAEGE
jgi:hypothetical protein